MNRHFDLLPLPLPLPSALHPPLLLVSGREPSFEILKEEVPLREGYRQFQERHILGPLSLCCQSRHQDGPSPVFRE